MLTVCHVLRYDPTIHKIKVSILLVLFLWKSSGWNIFKVPFQVLGVFSEQSTGLLFYTLDQIRCVVNAYHLDNALFQELIDSGAIGDLVHIQHFEPVGQNHLS